MNNEIIKLFEKLRKKILSEEQAGNDKSQDMYFNSRDTLDKSEEWLMRARREQKQ